MSAVCEITRGTASETLLSMRTGLSCSLHRLGVSNCFLPMKRGRRGQVTGTKLILGTLPFNIIRLQTHSAQTCRTYCEGYARAGVDSPPQVSSRERTMMTFDGSTTHFLQVQGLVPDGSPVLHVSFLLVAAHLSGGVSGHGPQNTLCVPHGFHKPSPVLTLAPCRGFLLLQMNSKLISAAGLSIPTNSGLTFGASSCA